MADIASGAAGKVLGPRPGKAACSFSKGIVEILLRVVNGVVGVFPVITGALVIAYTVDYSDDDNTTTSNSDNSSSSFSEPLAYTSGALSLGGGVLVVVWSVIMLLLRFLNIGLLNLGSKYFLSVDVIINLVLACVLVGGGVVSILAAVDWEDSDDGVFESAIASVVTCFLSAVLTVLLAIFMIIYIVKEWNDKIIKYTIKEAITG